MVGAEVVVRMLELYGVRHVFGVPGDTSMALYDALRGSSAIRHVVCRDERAASYMADGYARVSGRPGVCEFPSGAGVLCGLPGVSEADGSCIPLVCLNSDVPTTSEGRAALTSLDVEGVVRAVVRSANKVLRPDMIPRAVRGAFRHACAGRMGAAQVGLPEDVLSGTAEVKDLYAEEQCACYPAYRTRPDPYLVDRAARMIAAARRPLIVAGGGVHLSAAWAELERLVDFVRIPVVTSIDGKGSLAETTPFCLGVMGGNGGKNATNAAVGEADVVLCVGTKLNSTTTAGFSLIRGDAHVIQIDSDPGQIGNNCRIEVGIAADARLALVDLYEALVEHLPRDVEFPWDRWRYHVKKRVEAEFSGLARRFASTGSPVDPCAVVAAMQSSLPAGSIIVLDAGTPTPYFAAYYRTTSSGRSVIAARTHGALGYAVPASVGVKLARADRLVVAVFGEGSLAMALSDIETCVRNAVEVVFVLLRNNCFGWIKTLQRIYYGGRYWGVDFDPSVDYLEVFRAHGIAAYRACSGAELEEALGRVCREGGPAFVEVPVEPLFRTIPPVHAWEKDILLPEECRLRHSY